jgi:hypothetical protein
LEAECKKFPWPFLKLPNLELESFIRGRGKLSCLGQASMLPKTKKLKTFLKSPNKQTQRKKLGRKRMKT